MPQRRRGRSTSFWLPPMTPTLGDFLTIAGQRIAAAEQHRGRLPAAAHAEVTAELDRLLTVIARYVCDGLDPTGAAVTSPVPTRQELTIIGIRLTLLHATESIHRVAQSAGNRADTGHPVAADLRAAADALLAGRDLVHTHDSAPSDAGSDPLWAPTLNARPIAAALMRELCGYAPHLARLTARLSRPAPNSDIPLVTRQALLDATKWLTLTASAHVDDPTSRASTSTSCSCTPSRRTCRHPGNRQQTRMSPQPNCAPARPPAQPGSATSRTAQPASLAGRPPRQPPAGGTTHSLPPSSATTANCSCGLSPTEAASSHQPTITRKLSTTPPTPCAWP